MLRQLEADIAAVRLDDRDVPVKLRVYESLFVPMAKWSMLLTGNYRCVTPGETQPIHDAVHSDLQDSQEIYAWVDQLARQLGADPANQVSFEKYANAAQSLLKPSSAASAITAGANQTERVDKLVQSVATSLGMNHNRIDRTVAIVDQKLVENAQQAV